MKTIVVAGTGTGVGKTWSSVALLRAAARRGLRASAYKPVETGVVELTETDDAKLQAAATFHVKLPRWTFRPPVSPHLAAESEGIVLDPRGIARAIADLDPRPDLLVVETAGGLFSPLNLSERNLSLWQALERERIAPRPLLVSENRLGVLHHVLAVLAATPGMAWNVLLTEPGPRDLSSETNARELRRLSHRPVFELPFGSEAVEALLDELLL